MLQIKNISKKYEVGGLVTKALDDVSVNLRDNEFVAILGPSGSGKTTLLNIIGGLDRYDSGDLIIRDISTKQYKDRDWDSYRNHTVGFIFQSYNLIEHQSVLANVELALTISGISKKERRNRAKKALIEVGLKDHINKKPNQLSGGQMQRVAIARALVNNPDILLADEPTGALDSETSVQVMELLKEVAKDRLVVMVTHNPDLAQQYATRIVTLKDGKITSDSNEFIIDDTEEKAHYKNMGKSKMSYFTALSLSFKNLMTKKGRTILTAFAGSIGIIGIALILSLSNGVDQYIDDIQKDTMTSYPITITDEAIDLTSFMDMRGKTIEAISTDEKIDNTIVNAGYDELELSETIFSSVTENDLTSFKKYIDDENSEIHNYIGENGVVYTYDVNFSVFSYDEDKKIINSNADTQEVQTKNKSDSGLAGLMQQDMSMMTDMYTMASNASDYAPNFQEMMRGTDDVVSEVITDSYDMLYGEWPDKYNEVVLVLNHKNAISADKLYQLGFITAEEYEEIVEKIEDEKDPESITFDYKEMCKHKFYMVPLCDQYVENNDGTFTYIGEDASKYDDMIEDSLELKITGIVKPIEDAANATITTPIGYTSLLTDYIIKHTDDSDIITAQESDKKINVLNNMRFEAKSEKAKINDAKEYISNLDDSDKATFYQAIMYYESEGDDSANAVSALDTTATSYSAYGMTSTDDYNTTMAAMLDSYLENDPDKDILLSVYDEYIDGASYDENLKSFGKVSYDAPSSISIYTDSFENKDAVATCIEAYNKKADEKSQITYTDYVALLTSSITSIVDVISYVLIAFVAVSLIVSSIMIGIITYISVLERTKEIGILRAIGASKKNISQVFNAETFIIGLCSGIIGVGVSLLTLIPANALIHHLTDIDTINASLPPMAAVILVILSVILTLIGGLIPSKKAAKKDPVTALRSE